MEQSTETAPEVDKTPAKTEGGTKPLPSTEQDLHNRPSRTQSSGFRIALGVGVVVLLIVGFFVYRYVSSYEATDDAQVDGHINSVSARVSGHVTKLNVDDNKDAQDGTA